jgi:hypothetical protein
MRRFIFAAFTLVLLPQLAFALSLDEAKAKGLVGERQDGYLGVISGGSEAEALARTINNQRRALYQSSAAKNGTSQAAVEAVAGQKAQSLTPSGQYIQGSNGAWVKK